MSLEQYTMRDYLHAFRRRARLFFLVVAAIFGTAAIFAVALPDEFRSSAEMAINLEGPNIDLLEPVVLTAYADQYVKSLEQKVLTSKNLRAWLEESNIYAEDRETATEAELIKQMRNDIRVSMTFTAVIDERTGKEVDLITGFATAFTSRNPEGTHIVANNMAAAFLAEDKATRIQRAETTSGFLYEQIEAKQEEIIGLEAKIAAFKEENAGNLPELMFMNMTVLERTERDLENLQTQISALQQDRLFRQAQLDEIRRNSPSGARVAQLEEEYLRVIAIYGPDHPDVIRIKRQVAALTGGNISASGSLEIEQLETQLAEALQRYTEVHPDVVNLKRRIEALRAGGGSASGLVPQDVDYLQLRAQVNAIDTDLAARRARAAELREKQEELQVRIANTPQVERQYQVLTRDLQTAQLAFDDLRERLAQAQQTESFESGERGARLELVRNANVPIEPAGPQRLAILVLGILVSVTLAGGTILIAEMSDSTVRSGKDIRTMLHTHPIVAVPVVQNSLFHRDRRWQLARITLSGFLLAAIILVMYSVIGT